MTSLIQLKVNLHIQIAWIGGYFSALHSSLQHISCTAPELLMEIENSLFPVGLTVKGRCAERHLLSREEDVKVAHKSVHVIRVLHLQLEFGEEIQLLNLHGVDIQVL